jgi:hypothetical protein
MSDNSFIGPMTDNLINSFVDELKKKKNRDKVMKNIVEPILNDINDRYFPHMMTLTILIILVIVLLLLLLISNFKNNDCCNSHKNNLLT